MGLGLFIAKTLLERSGARLVFRNGTATPPRETGTPPEFALPSGAVVTVTWPRAHVMAQGAAREPLGSNVLVTG